MLGEVVEAVDVSLTTVSTLMDLVSDLINSVARLVGLLTGFSAEVSGVAEGTAPLFTFWSTVWTELFDPASDLVFATSLMPSLGCEVEPFETGRAMKQADRNATRRRKSLILD